MLLKTVLSMMCLAVIKMVDTTDADIIFIFRVAFVTGSGVALSLCLAIYLRILVVNDQRSFQVKESELNPPSPFQAMVQPHSKEKSLTVTVREYDTTKLTAIARSAVTTCAVAATLHLVWNFIPPLVLQSVLNVMNVFETELTRTYILCQDEQTHRELKRPWKTASVNPMDYIKNIKKEINAQMAAGQPGGAAAAAMRRNKKTENKRRVQKAGR